VPAVQRTKPESQSRRLPFGPRALLVICTVPAAPVRETRPRSVPPTVVTEPSVWWKRRVSNALRRGPRSKK
jgi:hypothetical protein